MDPIILATGCLALGVTWAGLFPLGRYLARSRVIDTPNERSSHVRATPRGGGLAIAVVTLVGWALYGVSSGSAFLPALLLCAVGAGLIAAVGFLDDLFSLPASVRFGVQTLAALLAMLGLGYWDSVHVPWLGALSLGALGLPLTFLWIAGLTNAYNFMDGLDGMAGGQALVAGMGWAVLGWLGGQPLVAVLGLLLAATNLGFLGHNWSPARIFMGDVGSTFLGYSFAILPLLARLSRSDQGAGDLYALAGVLLVWPSLFDTVFTILRRLRKGENILAAHRSHLYQRLVATGLSHRVVSSLYLLFALLSTLMALGWVLAVPHIAVIMTVTLPWLCLVLWSCVILREHHPSPAGTFAPTSPGRSEIRPLERGES